MCLSKLNCHGNVFFCNDKRFCSEICRNVYSTERGILMLDISIMNFSKNRVTLLMAASVAIILFACIKPNKASSYKPPGCGCGK